VGDLGTVREEGVERRLGGKCYTLQFVGGLESREGVAEKKSRGEGRVEIRMKEKRRIKMINRKTYNQRKSSMRLQKRGDWRVVSEGQLAHSLWERTEGRLYIDVTSKQVQGDNDKMWWRNRHPFY